MVRGCLSSLRESDAEVGRVADQALDEQVGAAAAAPLTWRHECWLCEGTLQKELDLY